MTIIETERLALREMTPDDAEHAYLLNLDPDVIRYTGDAPFASVEEARIFLLNYGHYRKYGFGRWAVTDKRTGAFFGWCGLKYTEELSEYDIGYRFMKRHWGYGYATEAAQACLRMGFNTFNIPVIVGRAMKENTASIRVLQKIGLTYWKEDSCGHEPGVIYKIENTARY